MNWTIEQSKADCFNNHKPVLISIQTEKKLQLIPNQTEIIRRRRHFSDGAIHIQVMTVA